MCLQAVSNQRRADASGGRTDGTRSGRATAPACQAPAGQVSKLAGAGTGATLRQPTYQQYQESFNAAIICCLGLPIMIALSACAALSAWTEISRTHAAE